VPLCDSALHLLDGATESYLFASPLHPDKHLGKENGDALGSGADGYDHVIVHGFRSTFKDWCRNLTRFENYVSEVALAHASGDKILAAYARSGVLQKRRKLMDAWAAFCSKPAIAGEAVPLRSAG
jgi:integrase